MSVVILPSSEGWTLTSWYFIQLYDFMKCSYIFKYPPSDIKVCILDHEPLILDLTNKIRKYLNPVTSEKLALGAMEGHMYLGLIAVAFSE